jgi:hypothetical protein
MTGCLRMRLKVTTRWHGIVVAIRFMAFHARFDRCVFDGDHGSSLEGVEPGLDRRRIGQEE